LINHFGDLDGRVFAVRSSGTTEDSHSTSFAGVYRSTLSVGGFDAICAAVLDCWRSYYSYPAILMRLRASEFNPGPGMAVIIQELIPAQFAGVAFRTGPHSQDLLVEYVHGLGDALVSGAVVPKTYQDNDGQPRSLVERSVLAQVVTASTRLYELFGHAVDVEWAWDNKGLFIVQVRPVTVSLRRSQITAAPYFATANLYLDDVLPPTMELGACAEVYAGYVAKRSGLYRQAVQSGVATGAALLLAFNGSGLLTHAAALDQLLKSTSAETVVLDINSNIRQIILNKDAVYSYLVTAFGLASTTAERHTIILRDYLKGQYGFISTVLGTTGLLIEYSVDGLMDINRGIAECYRIVVPEEGAQPVFEDSLSAQNLEEWVAILPAVTSFTRQINQQLPGCRLEWVLADGIPYVVDYSTERSEAHYTQHGARLVISPGTARGPVCTLADDTMLSRLSVGPAISVNKTQDIVALEPFKELLDQVFMQTHKPIIYARQPYAALAVLFEYVAGFVFERGSLLCHLAILLREAGIPAVIAPGFSAAQQDSVLIANGRVTRLVAAGMDMGEERL
jgi:rifampicin phosphotransferase